MNKFLSIKISGLLITLISTIFCISVSSTFSKGFEITDADSTNTLKININDQNQYLYDYNVDTEKGNSKFFIRRFRLKFSGNAINENISYKFQLGLSNRDQGKTRMPETSDAANLILDAVIQIKTGIDDWEFWIGQTKTPGNREALVSSSKLQFVERSNLDSEFGLERDMGIQLTGKYAISDFIIKPRFSVVSGEGRNVTASNLGGYNYSGRLELLPFGEFENKGDYFYSALIEENTPKLSLGFAANFNHNSSKQGGQSGRVVSDTAGNLYENNIMSLFADAHFKYKKLSIYAAYANANTSEDIIDVENKYLNGSGFNFQAGYMLGKGWEVAARYSHIEPNKIETTYLTESNVYTFAINKFIDNHNLKINSDFSLLEEGAAEKSKNYQARIQLQLGI